MTIDGSLYHSPGYLTLAGFFYNTIFQAEHGWGGQSLEELIAPNEQAKAEGNPAYGVLDGADGQRFLQLTNASAQFLTRRRGRLGNRIIQAKRVLAGHVRSLLWTSISFGSTA